MTTLGIFLDIETTGLDPVKHRVIEIAFKIYDLSTGEKREEYHEYVRQPKEVWDLCDPVSLEINGFTWEEVQQGKSEAEVASTIKSLFGEQQIERGAAVFICQNPAFDRAFFAQLIDIYTQEELRWPYHWLDFASMYWAYKVLEVRTHQTDWPKQIVLSKDAIASEYQLDKEQRPHRAMNGVEHLLLCYQTVVGMGHQE